MNRILVATDGSEGADRAVDYAAARARAENAELVIANVIGGHSLPDKALQAFTHAQQTWLQELLASLSAETLAKARERARQIGVDVIVLESRRGDVARALIEIAQERQATSIIVGKRGTGFVGGMLLGSVAHKLVSLSPLPVTVVP
ncbi:MAG: universal stress protein [Proteobacteria bacterium]|nr:universal stress protein [Pseudomonadota bacterium]